MKTIITFKNKKISRKQAEELIGKDKFATRLAEAKEVFFEDPMTLISWADGLGIEFK